MSNKQPNRLPGKHELEKQAAVLAERQRLLAGAGEPIAHAISYDGKTPYSLWIAGDGALLDLEVKRQGGTTSKMALYTADQLAAAVLREREACLACYSPDDTAQDWADKIRARGQS